MHRGHPWRIGLLFTAALAPGLSETLACREGLCPLVKLRKVRHASCAF